MTREKEYVIAMNSYPEDFKVSLKEMINWFKDKPEQIKIFKDDMNEDVFKVCIDFSITIVMAKRLAVQF